MNLLMIGDVVGSCGRRILSAKLWNIRRTMGIDVVIANGENASAGNGLLPDDAEDLYAAGVDVITSGNHIWQRREIYSYLDDHAHIVRPANYPPQSPGCGSCFFDTGKYRILVINVMGTVFMEALADPFDTVDRILEKHAERADFILVDVHAEATSEKRALGYYLDGRVTAVVGTHTHVQTNDAAILPGGTAYLTDLGMTGAVDSILGVEKEIILKKFREKLPVRFVQAEGAAEIEGLLLSIDETSKKVKNLEVIKIS